MDASTKGATKSSLQRAILPMPLPSLQVHFSHPSPAERQALAQGATLEM